MDIVELKGINSKMLRANASSVQCIPIPTTTISPKLRRARNEAYCEFDIMANYKEKQRNAKLKQQREGKHKMEKSELSKKIEDLTARNVKIKQMLVAKGNDPVEKHSNTPNDKTMACSEKRQREHKSRRTGSRRKEDKSSEYKAEEKLISADSLEKPEKSGGVKIRLGSSSKEQKRPKHRSRKDRSEESHTAYPDDTSTSRTGTITVTVTSPKNTKRTSRRSSDVSESRRGQFRRKEAQIVEELEQVPESKSQLVNVYNYKSKSEEGQDENTKKVIMVFENNNILEETDSLMSKETLKKSKTRTPSYSRDRSGGRQWDSEKNEHRHKTIKVDDSLHGDRSARSIRRRSKSSRKVDSAETIHENIERVRMREMSPIYSISPRKELSFSNLILKPTVLLYDTPPQVATTQTSVSRIETPGFGTKGVIVDEAQLEPEVPKIRVMKLSPVLSQTTIALRDIMKVKELEQAQQLMPKNIKPNSFIKSKMMEYSTSVIPHQDCMGKNTSIKSAISKNSKFHKSKQVLPTDRIVEISSKIFNDEKVTFTVEGVEPPKRLHNANVKSMKIENVFTLQVFPGITITQSDLKSHLHGNTNNIETGAETISTFKNSTVVDKHGSESIGDIGSSNIITSNFHLDSHSECKPKSKESSEVSYKFRKKCWSSKELPRKISTKVAKVEKKVEIKDELKARKDKKRDWKEKCNKKEQEVQTLTKDVSIQTVNVQDNLVEAGIQSIYQINTDVQTISTFDIGVSTRIQACNVDGQKSFARKRCLPVRQISQSESNITLNEKYICKQNYGTCTDSILKSHIVRPNKKYETKKVGVSNSHIDYIKGVSNKDTTEKGAPHQTNKRPFEAEHRTRKYSHSCSPKPRESSPTICNPVMSTGSIKTVAVPTRKSRSKSLSHGRDSLVEKINYNKKTIMHHNQEIAALEKCLNEILHRLVRRESKTKHQECDISKESERVCITELSNESIKAKAQLVKAKPEKSKIPMSKFQRAKAYGERLKQRSKRSNEFTTKASIISSAKSLQVNSKTNNKNKNMKTKYRKGHDCATKHASGNYSPVKLRSVYKNSKGFISSATSLSSKISDLIERSSSTYPQSIPSLNIGCAAINKQHDCLRASSSSDHKRKNIIKKKHKIHSKGPVFSKKKSQSIYDMLMEYIHLGHTSSGKMESPEMKAIKDSVSKIVVLSVSSVKLRHTSKYINSVLPPSPIAEIATDSMSSDLPKDKGAISKKPFFMTQNNIETAPTVQNTQDLTSADSLEFDTHNTHTPDLCPLTAIFNFEPPSYAYFVYNTEVITNPNTPKLDAQPGTSYCSPLNRSIASTPPTTHKLLPIIEEKPISSVQQALVTAPSPPISVIYHEKERPTADLSPVLNRKVYPSYSECMKELEMITSQLPEVKPPKQPTRLTSFNCNHKECSQLIFNYTSKRDKHPLLREKHESSAYNTRTTLIDSKSASGFSDSETGLKNQNESGYESSKKSSSFKNFFKKRTLLDVFKSKSINKKKSTDDISTRSASLKALEEKRSPCIFSPNTTFTSDKIEPEGVPPYSESKTVLWFNFRKKKRDSFFPCDPWCSKKNQADQTDSTGPCKTVCHKGTKCMTTGSIKGTFKNECPCNLSFAKQKEQCQKYASKVLLEAAKRQEGYKKQYDDFEELPLNVLIGKRNCLCKPLGQTCTQSYANKVAAIQVKQEQHNQPVQVKEIRPKSINIVEPIKTEKPPKTPVPDRKLRSFDEDDDDDDVDDGPDVASMDDVSQEKRCLTDKEIFDKLLRNYERKETIATRLSSDDTFFNEQIESVNAGVVPDIQVQERLARQEEEKMRGPRFSDRPRPLVQVTNADTIVKPDDIGTCFARGFRPDNLMLSGDACFHINKQDKIKMSPYMLKNTESIIDFSERETPLDFLLALGFMVDEASNALKDDDIRSRLLAAITEARVWINKITTTQGTLLYLVAYKARPETMRYFLQLVEAIINKRINNAIRLDGFLRVLEDVEAGRLQMINILGEDKFEDEENEEKIVKKQLKNLFISVYSVAEKEAAVTGRTLISNQISLLRILVAKYRAGLHPHLELIARYIGQGLLENEIQLEAAMIFLSRLDTAEVKLKEFENYCGITCQLQDA